MTKILNIYMCVTIMQNIFNNKKELFRNVLNQQPVDSVPLWELEFHLWDEYDEGHWVIGDEFKKLSSKEKDLALHENAELIARVTEKTGFSAVTLPANFWELSPGHPAYFWLPEEAIVKQAEIVQKLIGNDVMIVANTGGVIAIPASHEYVAFSQKLFISPDEVEQLAETTLQRGIETIKKFAGVGVEAFFTASDIADNSGPYFSPDHFQRFILPCLQKWALFVRSIDGLAIMHTDGNINIYLDDLSQSGIHAIQAIDPVAGMDMKETLESVQNKITLCGNVDCGVLLTGSPEDVYALTKSELETCKGIGSFVLGASNAVQVEVPKGNYDAYLKAWIEFRDCSIGL